MMKKIFVLALVVAMVLTSLVVDAGNYDDYMIEGEYIPGIYITRVSSDGAKRVMQAKTIRRRSDNSLVYCIEPMVSIDFGVYYDSYTSGQADKLNISADLWKKISLIAYYGYGYANHTDMSWYAITQFMIWQEIAPQLDTYFTDTLNGNRIEVFREEIQELYSLVEKHSIVPDFGGMEFTVNMGDKLTLVDKNNVLSTYEVYNMSGSVMSSIVINNRIEIDSRSEGSGVMAVYKMDRRFTSPPILYYDDVAQKVMSIGSYDYYQYFVTVNVITPQEPLYKLKVIKIDEDTNAVIKELGIMFKLTNTITLEEQEYQTNEDGYFVVHDLAKGIYLLEELDAPIGYSKGGALTIEVKDADILIKVPNKKVFVDSEYKIQMPNTYIS